MRNSYLFMSYGVPFRTVRVPADEGRTDKPRLLVKPRTQSRHRQIYDQLSGESECPGMREEESDVRQLHERGVHADGKIGGREFTGSKSHINMNSDRLYCNVTGPSKGTRTSRANSPMHARRF